MKKQSRIENLISKFLQLHDRKIDLSLDRINRLNKDLKINFEKIQDKTISICGTNGKWSNAITIFSIFKAAGYKVDLFTSPHVQKYTERFIFESKETGDFEPGLDGEDLPVTELDLHQYADMSILKSKLSAEHYDIVRNALGLESMKSATEKGKLITDKIRENIDQTPSSGVQYEHGSD